MLTKKESTTLVGISLMTFLVFLDITIVSTALPAIQRDLSASLDGLQWILNAMFLALSALMATVGRIADLLGRRKIVYLAAVTFLLASIGAGFASSIGWLIFYRFLQGIAGASIPVSAALLANHFSKDRQHHILALFAMINGCGLALGPLVGGVLVETLGWRWIFFINVPVIMVALMLCAYSVQEQRSSDPDERFNISAALAMIIGISALIVALTQAPSWGWGNQWVLALFVLSAVSLVTFVEINRKAQHPVIDFDVFKNRYVICAALCCFCMGGIIGVLLFLNPIYLQSMRGQSAEYSGFVLLGISGSFLAVSPFLGKFVGRYGVKHGMYVMTWLCVVTSTLHYQFSLATPLWLILLAFITFGVPWSLGNVAPTLAAVSAVDQKHSAVTLGSIWTIWNLGSCVALAVCGFLLRWGGEGVLSDLLADQHIVLKPEQLNAVSHLISDPEHAQRLLSEYSGQAHSVIAPILKDAFMHGFHLSSLFLVAMSIAVTIVVYFSLQTAKEVKVAEDQSVEY